MMRDWGTEADNRNSRPMKLTIWQNECLKSPDTHIVQNFCLRRTVFLPSHVLPEKELGI